MAEKPYRWTVDVEYDWGGRTNGGVGLTVGVPRILSAFKEAQIKALFFISTETVEAVPGIIHSIQSEGHEIGSHGHFHLIFKDDWRISQDKQISDSILKTNGIETRLYRAPKFYYDIIGQDCVYANSENHVSLLKHLWLGQKIKPETIIYLHPFDIVETTEAPPNLFCRLWYSRPKKAYKLFQEMVNKYK